MSGADELAVREAADGVRVIEIEGEVTSEREALAEAYERAAAKGVRTVALDFSDLEYMNSGGIGLLVTLLVRAQRQKVTLVAFGLTDHYRQIFELTRLDEAIDVHDSESALLAGSGS
ncbi:MAG: STAS domain-containing protein [Solirubrobacterales bacterium]